MVTGRRGEIKHTVTPTAQFIQVKSGYMNTKHKFTKSSLREALDCSPLSWWGSIVQR